MEIIGIVAEYNPFHNGHLYQIKEIKKRFPDSLLVVVMNGNFSQRGEPTIVDKWNRCEMALENGIDLVVEIPFVFATQSADIFAHGAISLLKELKVDKIVFGSETNDVSLLNQLADIELYNQDYNKLVNSYLQKGYNYPTSMSKALFDLSSFRIRLSNDLLGLSYIKEIKKQKTNIEPISIKRTNDYKSYDLGSDIVNASCIRKAIGSRFDITKYVPIYHEKHYKRIYLLEDYFPFLKYKIMVSKDLSLFQTVDEGIENRINKYILKANSFEELINLVKTKRYTYNKLSRMFCHILCDFTKEEAKKFKDIEYIRPLGFSEQGKKYLNKIKKEVNLPIVSRFASLKDNELLQLEYRIAKVYQCIVPNNKDLIEEEYKRTPIYYK